MGAWGTALYSDDVAMDIRGLYKELLGEGYSNEIVTKALVRICKEQIEDEEDGPVFWLALADIQWKCGRLMDEVKKLAIEVIDSGMNLERWKENKSDYKKRALVLEKLKEQLLSPQLPEKKIKKVFKSFNPFQLYDAISYKLLSGKYIILKVVGERENNGNTNPIFEICDWIGESIPSIKDINELPCIRDGVHLIGMISVRDFPKKRINVIAQNVKVVNLQLDNYPHTAWKMLDEDLRRRNIV